MTIQGDVVVNGRARESVPVKVWPASAFVTAPATNTALPATGQMLASTTSGPQHGSGQGSYRFTGLPPLELYTSAEFAGSIYYSYFAGAPAPGASGLVTFTATLTGSLTEGMGLVYTTSLPGFVNQVPHYACLLGLMTAYTPTASGADLAELPAPMHPDDGTTALSFNSRRITWRCAASGSTSGTITLQKSLAATTGAFDPVTIGTLTLLPGRYEAFTATGLVGVSSGDKIRVFVNTLPAATSWTITLLVGTT